MKYIVLLSLAAAWLASIMAMVLELESLPNTRTGAPTVVRVYPK